MAEVGSGYRRRKNPRVVRFDHWGAANCGLQLGENLTSLYAARPPRRAARIGALINSIGSRFVSKNRSITIALSWLAVRPHRRAALRLMTAGPVSTAVQARSGKTTLLPYGIRLGSMAQCPAHNRRPVLAYLGPSPAQ